MKTNAYFDQRDAVFKAIFQKAATKMRAKGESIESLGDEIWTALDLTFEDDIEAKEWEARAWIKLGFMLDEV